MRLTDLTLILPDRVGALATALGAIDRVGVEVLGCGGFPAWAGEGILHVTVEDVDGASAALRDAGIAIREEREILTTGPLAGTSEICGAASATRRGGGEHRLGVPAPRGPVGHRGPGP